MPIENEDAARAVADFASGPASEAADATAKAFELAGERIAQSLSKAARTGELSFNSLAESITQDLARLAINELIVGPLNSAIGGIGGGLGGAGTGGTARGTTINMNIAGVSDAGSFQRSKGQISATLARAVLDGQRYI